MNTNVREYIDECLLPALYERLDQPGVLDEFAFKRKGKCFVSTSRHKHTGREGKTAGQVYVYANNPAYLIDHTEVPRSQEIISYVQHIREGADIGFISAIGRLAEMAGIEPFKIELTQAQAEAIEKDRRHAALWEAAANYCINCIHESTYKEMAKPAIDYLLKRRNYTLPDINAMNLGFYPGIDKVHAAVIAKGFNADEVSQVIRFPIGAGSNYQLAIPMRNQGGAAIGMALRKVYGDGPKYLYNTGLNKGQTLFNLHGRAYDGRIILVEGQMDAAIADARGYSYGSTAAMGGKTITEGQLSHIAKSGAREVYISLDNEPGIEKNISDIIGKVKALEGVNDNIFIVELPGGYKDADELITKEGIEAYEECVKRAVAYYKYFANQAIEEFEKKTGSGATDAQVHELIDEIERIAVNVIDAVKREDLKDLFIQMLKSAGLNVSRDAFSDAVDRLKYKADEQRVREAATKILKENSKLLADGAPVDRVLKNVEELRTLGQQNNRIEFEKLAGPVNDTRELLMERMASRPKAVQIGYQIYIDGEAHELELPAAQITFFAAVTGHGKTRFLINSALNIINTTNRTVYFFTFEQPEDYLILMALNVYVNETLNKGSNRKTLKQYMETKGNARFISNEVKNRFLTKERNFYEKVRPRLKITNKEWDAAELIRFIDFIAKKDPDAVIIIDYIQKLRLDKVGSIANRYTELKFILEDLNAAAMRTGLPIACGTQLKREVGTPLDMHKTNMSEASDIEKIASEIYGIWDCTSPFKKVDSKEAQQIASIYGIDGQFKREPAIILQILKSRSMGEGHHVKIQLNSNTGYVGAMAVEGSKVFDTDIFEK